MCKLETNSLSLTSWKGTSGMSGRFWPVLAGFSQVPPANSSASKPPGARPQTICLPDVTSAESGWN